MTASGRDHAVATCDYGGAMQVVGDEPNHHQVRLPAGGSKGARSAPSPAQCTHIG